MSCQYAGMREQTFETIWDLIFMTKSEFEPSTSPYRDQIPKPLSHKSMKGSSASKVLCALDSFLNSKHFGMVFKVGRIIGFTPWE